MGRSSRTLTDICVVLHFLLFSVHHDATVVLLVVVSLATVVSAVVWAGIKLGVCVCECVWFSSSTDFTTFFSQEQERTLVFYTLCTSLSSIPAINLTTSLLFYHRGLFSRSKSKFRPLRLESQPQRQGVHNKQILFYDALKTEPLHCTICSSWSWTILHPQIKKRPHTGDVTQTPDTALFCVSKICHSFILPQEQVKLPLQSPLLFQESCQSGSTH